MIRSKAYVSTEEMGDQYILMGPYKEASARTEVEEIDFPSNSPLNKAVQIMRDQGFKVRFQFPVGKVYRLIFFAEITHY